MKEDIKQPAVQVEVEMDTMFEEGAPEGRFSMKVLNKLVEAFNAVQKIMGFAEGELYPEFSEDQTRFPAEFVRGISMVAQAAEDYGQPGLIDLSNVTDDADVAALASALMGLADDPGFKEFMAEPMPEEEVPAEEESMDDLFMARV